MPDQTPHLTGFNDPFIDAARAEAGKRWPRLPHDPSHHYLNMGKRVGFVLGAQWATEQKPTDAEVEAAAEAWEAHTPAEFHEDEGEMCCRECGEAFDWVPLDAARFDARRRAHRFRAALSAARAARRDEEKRAACGCDLTGMAPPAVHIVDRHEERQ